MWFHSLARRRRARVGVMTQCALGLFFPSDGWMRSRLDRRPRARARPSDDAAIDDDERCRSTPSSIVTHRSRDATGADHATMRSSRSARDPRGGRARSMLTRASRARSARSPRARVDGARKTRSSESSREHAPPWLSTRRGASAKGGVDRARARGDAGWGSIRVSDDAISSDRWVT